MRQNIEIAGTTFHVTEKACENVMLYQVARPDMADWFWTAKTSEEVRAYLAGFHAGAMGRMAA